MQHAQTFKKEERICNRKLIGKLFSDNQSFFQYPFKVIYHIVQPDDHRLFTDRYPVQVLFTIPKKRFKRAVDRNRLKRLMREAYRKNKHAIYEILVRKQNYLALGFIYTGKQPLSYNEIEKKIKAAIMRLKQELNETQEKHTNHVEP